MAGVGRSGRHHVARIRTEDASDAGFVLLPTFGAPHDTLVMGRAPGATAQALDALAAYVWTFLDEAADPSVMVAGAIVVTGDPDEPVMARVVDIVGTGAEALVHLDVLPGPAALYADAVHRSELSAAS